MDVNELKSLKIKEFSSEKAIKFSKKDLLKQLEGEDWA